MSNININVTFNLDKDMVAMLMGLLGGSVSVKSEETQAEVITDETKPAEEKEEVVLDRPSKFDEWKQAHPAIATLCDNLSLELTDENVPRFVRKAMEDVRLKIEGEGYTKDSPHHRELTAEFKRLSALLGAEKPSALPIDKVESFIEAINMISVDGGKLNIADNLPF